MSLSDHFRGLGLTGRVGLVSTAGIHDLYGKDVEQALAVADCKVFTALIPDGEGSKNLRTISTLYDTFLNADLDRSSTLISLGGGVVGDITGFVAATLFRGISYIQIPTTLLAMVDASIGGKTGVNHPSCKNLIGAFHQPRAVLIDPTLIHTLPQREITTALAEIIKTAAISDREFFHFVAENIQSLIDLSDPEILEDAIIQTCRVKVRIVKEDEREGDRRRILNFGHTLGHALETSLGYNNVRHGEAVGLGMVAAGLISTIVTGFSKHDLEHLISPITCLQLPRVRITNFDSIYEYLHHDKKIRQGVVHFVLLKTIGQPVVTADVKDEQIEYALTELERRFG